MTCKERQGPRMLAGGKGEKGRAVEMERKSMTEWPCCSKKKREKPRFLSVSQV